MDIALSVEQQQIIEDAIQSGLVRSLDEFICSAMAALRRDEDGFDIEKAQRALTRILELRSGVKLDLQDVTFRELAHSGHKY